MIVEIKVPSPGESITTVELSKWFVDDSEIVEKNQDIAEIDSDKATLTISSVDTGMIKILVKEGETISVGTIIGTIDTSAVNTKSSEKKEVKIPSKNIETNEKEKKKKTIEPSNLIVSPQALKMLSENDINISEVLKEKSKRLTKKDIIDAIKLKAKDTV